MYHYWATMTYLKHDQAFWTAHDLLMHMSRCVLNIVLLSGCMLHARNQEASKSQRVVEQDRERFQSSPNSSTSACQYGKGADFTLNCNVYFFV